MSYELCKWLRCGFQWRCRRPYNHRQDYKKDHVPARCARCRSKYWNKPYTRDYRATGRLNKGSIAYTPPLPFPSHDAGKVRSKKISSASPGQAGNVGQVLAATRPTSSKKTFSRSIKPCVKRKTKTKRGKIKRKTKS